MSINSIKTSVYNLPQTSHSASAVRAFIHLNVWSFAFVLRFGCIFCEISIIGSENMLIEP